MDIKKKWIFIINPVAGNGTALKLSATVKEKILEYKIPAGLVYTERKGHASELSEFYARKGYKFIIGVGGDGTFNEIASPLVNNRDIILGMIPGGTGNDFIRITGFTDHFDNKDWEVFFEKNIMASDAGKCNGLYFFNGMGLGFDAQVAAENYTTPGDVKRGGKSKYIFHILKTLFLYKEKHMTAGTGFTEKESDCFINTVAIGRRFAGGFLLTPKAIANDGLFDVCMIERLSIPKRLRLLMKVPEGLHIEDEKVNYYQTDKLTVTFKTEVPFHLDGELYFSKKMEVEVIPGAFNIIYNPYGSHFFNTKLT
jgi:YegS/Rv2252/BmrU family lipid kinase